jgi:AcrR family transcriptional regulator
MLAAPPTPKGLQTRERILKAAGAVFWKTGYGASGVADICAAAELAVGGFYRYFAGKEAVLEALVADLEAELSREVGTLPERKELRDEIEAIAGLYFRFVEKHKEAYQVMREAEFVCERASRKFYDSFAAAVGARLAGHGAARADNEAPVYSLIGMLSFVAVRNLIWRKRPVPKRAVSDAADVFVGGVSGLRPDFRALVGKAVKLRKLRPAAKREPDTAARLLASAETVFGKKGYGTAHISEIAARAGYAAGTFYTCYDSKRDALGRLVLALRDELVSKAVEYSTGAASRTETEVMAFLALFDFISEHPYGYKIMREAEFVDFRLAEDFYIYILNAYTDRMRATARPGEFVINDYAALSLMMMGIGHMLGFKYALLKDKGPGPEEMKDMLRSVFSGFDKTKND